MQTKTLKLATILTGLVALAACGGSGAGGKSSTGAVKQACLDSSNMGEAICDCVAKKAGEDLTADQRAFLVASFTEDEATADAARAKLDMQELTEVGMYMVTTPAACAAENAG